MGVSGHRAAAEILSYPSGWEGALRDGHSHQPHHVTVQVDTASVLPMPQNPPAEVWEGSWDPCEQPQDPMPADMAAGLGQGGGEVAVTGGGFSIALNRPLRLLC